MERKFMLGYIFGSLCMKGSVIYDEKKSSYLVSFETAKKDLMDIFRGFWENLNLGNFHMYQRQYKNVPRFIFHAAEKKTARRFYYKYGIRTGSAKWKIPRENISDKDFSRGVLSGVFDSSSYIRIRIREKSKGKKEKVRNIRVVSPNRFGLESVRNMLSSFHIKPMIYPSGKNYCLDIEGKMKLEIFRSRIGFLLDENKIRLEEAISFLS